MQKTLSAVSAREMFLSQTWYDHRSMNESIAAMRVLFLSSSLTNVDEMYKEHYDINMSFE